jgi:CxxC motif-containing protein (DUF1111 family)
LPFAPPSRSRTVDPSRGRRFGALVLTFALVVLSACSGDDGGATEATTSSTTAPATVAELTNQGGIGTVSVSGVGAFAQPMKGLTHEQRRTFAVGNSFFNQNWVTAPASTEGRDGLGPIFNAQSCSSCHFKDGRGRPPESPDDPERGLLVRISVEGPDGEVGPHPTLGGQFQDRSIRGVDPEGSVVITTTERAGTYADGTAWSLAVPTYELVDVDGVPIEGLLLSPRVAPAMMGVGLLENIPAADLEAAEDPDDADGDGISGRVHRVTDPSTGDTVIGRFGWKAAVPTVEEQNASAFSEDIGITSSLHPDPACTDAQTACREQPDGGRPEINDEKMDQVTFYARTLAVPARRDAGSPDTTAGQSSFDAIGCAACHTAVQRTGPSDLAPLDAQVIRPYTDLLLHDLGPDLADDRPDGDATGREWRTPPLWGIGLVESVNKHTRFLHDGRARSIEEAILWHGGEAQAARDRFIALPAGERRRLLDFLESL